MGDLKMKCTQPVSQSIDMACCKRTRREYFHWDANKVLAKGFFQPAPRDVNMRQRPWVVCNVHLTQPRIRYNESLAKTTCSGLRQKSEM